MILAPYMAISCDEIVKLTTCWSHIVGVHFGEFFPCWNINQKRRRTTTPLFSFSHFLSFSLSFSPLLHQYHIHLAIFPGGLLRIHRTNNGYLWKFQKSLWCTQGLNHGWPCQGQQWIQGPPSLFFFPNHFECEFIGISNVFSSWDSMLCLVYDLDLFSHHRIWILLLWRPPTMLNALPRNAMFEVSLILKSSWYFVSYFCWVV